MYDDGFGSSGEVVASVEKGRREAYLPEEALIFEASPFLRRACSEACC